MKDQRTTNHVRIAAIVLWAVTGILLLGAWALSAKYHPEFLVLMTAATAVVLAIGAGVATVRVAQLRLQRLVRMTAGLIYTPEPVERGRHEERRGLRSVP